MERLIFDWNISRDLVELVVEHSATHLFSSADLDESMSLIRNLLDFVVQQRSSFYYVRLGSNDAYFTVEVCDDKIRNRVDSCAVDQCFHQNFDRFLSLVKFNQMDSLPNETK